MILRMLKFTDLSVDMKNFDNSFDFFMKLFPNTYLPLLIMYLSREGLLKVESGVDKNDPRALLRITSKEIVDFFGINYQIIKESKTMTDLIASLLGLDFSNEAWHKKYDVDCWLPCANMISKIIEFKFQTFTLVYDCNDNQTLNRIKDILCAKNSETDEPAAYWLFCEFLIQKCPTITENSGDWEMPNSIRLFDSILEKQQGFSKDKVYIQPHKLTRIILSQYKGGTVYNPFAGLASYHVEMAHGIRNNVGEGDECWFHGYDTFYDEWNSLGKHYYGSEIDEITWALGKLRLMFYHMDSPNYILGDSTKEFKGEVNNIFCTPPFNMQITNEKGEREYADHFVLRRGIKMLADEGMMAVVVPMSFFSRKDTFDIRKELVSRHLLTRIVCLPENVFSVTRINTAIIFVEKGSEQDKVKFVDATKLGLDITITSNLIEHNEYPMGEQGFTFGMSNSCPELTPEVYHSCVCFEDYGNITDIDYDLSPSKYFSSYVDIPEGFKLAWLKDLVSTKEPKNVLCDHEGKVIANRNLTKEFQLPYIDYMTLESKVVNANYKQLEKKALLISAFNELSPSLFEPKDGEITFVSPNVLAFYLNDKKIYAEYLIGELSKDYVKEQLRMKMMGSTLHRIKHHDIQSLQILVPDGKGFLQKEKEIIEEQKNANLRKISIELAELKDKRHDEYVRMLRQRKHRIQQVMNELTPAFALLNQCRVENGGILRNSDVVAERTGETVESYFNRLRSIVEKVEDLVTNFVDKNHWEDAEIVNIDHFVNEIPKQHVSDKYQFQVYIDRDVEIYENEELDLNDYHTVKANKNDLSTVFDNIIANATKWGFTEAVRRDYTIRIEVFDSYIENHQAVKICISNNGTPIHPSVDRKRFFDWGYGSGTGIGTWQLKDIVEHYGGAIRLNEYPGEISGFQTEYEIVLPLADND